MSKNIKTIILCIFIIIVLLIVNFVVYIVYTSVINHKSYSQFKASFIKANQFIKASFYEGQGEICTNFGKYKQSIKYYDKALVIYPNYPAAYKYRAGAESRIGDVKSAQADFLMYEKLTGNKYFFNFNAYKDKNLKKYLDYVWQNYYKKELYDNIPEDILKKYGNPKENIEIIVADFNDDGQKDIITVAPYGYYCGTTGCSIMIFVSDNNGTYKPIDVIMNRQARTPIYVLDSKTNGLRNIVLNEKFLLKFNNKDNMYE